MQVIIQNNWMKLVALFTLLSIVGFMSPVQVITPELDLSDAKVLNGLTASLDQALRTELKENHIPGVGIVIVQNGKTVYKKGYGKANMRTGKDVDPDKTIFRIGSISKALTLLTLTKMIDDGRLDMDEDVGRYFDNIHNPNNYSEPLTMRHLLTHTTGLDQIGIGRHVQDWEKPLAERQAQRPKLAEFLNNGNIRRVSPAGDFYRYDTYGTTLAGVIIEMVAGKYYPEAMKAELFEPLGMKNAMVDVDVSRLDDMAVGHGYNNGNYEEMPFEVYKTLPASSINATVADMGRLLEALTGDGSNGHGRLFSKAMVQTIMQGQFEPHTGFIGMSHGLAESSHIGEIPEAYELRTLGHGGDMLGFKSNMVIIPSMNIGIFVVANRNRESGGGNVNLWRVVMGAFMDYLNIEKKVAPFKIKKVDTTMDLNDYVGNYYFGVFCHSCTEEEYAQGGWRRGRPQTVTIQDQHLVIGEHKYIPQGGDLFVRSDGYQQLFFGRNKRSEVSHFVRTDELNSFEKIMD